MAYPSTFLDLQVAVADNLRLDSPSALAKVKDWLNAVYAEVCVEAEYTQTSGTAALSASDTSKALPTGIIRARTVQSKASGGAYGAPMQRVSMDKLTYLRSQNAVAATPTHYTIRQATIEFYPTAVGGETLIVWGVSKPTALSAGTDLPAIDEPYATNLLIAGAMLKAADFLKDTDVLAYYKAQYDENLARFKNHVSMRVGDPIEQPLNGQPVSLAARP